MRKDSGTSDSEVLTPVYGAAIMSVVGRMKDREERQRVFDLIREASEDDATEAAGSEDGAPWA